MLGTLLGRDMQGDGLLAALQALSMVRLVIGHVLVTHGFSQSWQDVSQVQRSDAHSTAVYNALLNVEGEMVHAVGAMDIFAQLNAAFVDHAAPVFTRAGMLCVDGNLTMDGLHRAVTLANAAGVPGERARGGWTGKQERDVHQGKSEEACFGSARVCVCVCDCGRGALPPPIPLLSLSPE